MKRKTTEEFMEYVEKTTNGEYALTGEYNGNKVKTSFVHNTCGNEFMMKPIKFSEGHRCPYCSKNNRSLTMLEARSHIQQKYPDMYLLKNYSGMTKTCIFYHLECGMEFEATPHDVARGKKCPFCTKTDIGKSESFQRKIYSRFGEKIFMTENFKGMPIPMTFMCSSCGKSFRCKPKKLLEFKKCPICSDEYDKMEIELFLETAGIRYEKDHMEIPGIVLNFDFYIPEYRMLIDYEGRSTYDDIPGIKMIPSIKNKIPLKKIWCMKNKTNYLRIPYWESERINRILFEIFDGMIDHPTKRSFEECRKNLDIETRTSYRKRQSSKQNSKQNIITK